MEIIPAILPKDLNDLTQKLELVKELVDTMQIDFCEGGFMPSQSLPFTDALDYEAHLMVPDPRPLIDDLVRAGFLRILVQVEALSAESFADAIHEWRGSVEIGPSLEIETPLEALSSFAHELKTIQLMGIAHIGKQGEPFDARVVARVREAHARFPHLVIAVDGGVSLANARALTDAGATRLVVGSAIFSVPDVKTALVRFKQMV